MVKKADLKKRVEDSDDEYDSEDEEKVDKEDEEESVDSDMMIAARDAAEKADDDEELKKFGLKAINDEEGMLVRLKEMQQNFYNRLESKKLIKKQGKVPFTEHMTISK